MFLIHRKGLARDGDRPVLVYAYGGFGWSWTPRFDPTWWVLFERGAVVAVANLRGGGELGEDWHRAGMREKKSVVFDDWIAALDWLIAQRWTRPGRIAVAGGSNGGIAVGAVVNRRPELLGAAVLVSPLTDMLRFHHFLLARYWVPEYGSAEDPAAFGWLREYSPYHHVREGVRYPAVLVEAGENDSRVHPLHARKYAARLQAATAADPAARPILLYVEPAMGHGVGVGKEQQLRGDLDKRTFVMWQLGMLQSR
jgi:prolyl oligopeptidase